VPWYAKALAIAAAAYAFSPIDLIPDFIPIIGYLDDLLLLPGMIALAIALIPDEVMQEMRQEAAVREIERPHSHGATLFVVLLWLAGAALLFLWLA
ncbi:MAG: DUF1232 domain-containing protein, partial [Gammaproteobacteria bacterium]|nr:DUF1232 domain-containing protein [Gammaproteobacteria bacterium]